MKQEFNESVEYVAGRDVVNNHHTTMLQSPLLKPESQLQTEFAQRTGIWCPKPAREWMEYLMDQHRFTVREITAAWKAGSIGWNADKNEKRILTPWFEAAFAYGVIGTMGIYLLIVAFHLIFGAEEGNKWGVAATYGIGALYMGVCGMIHRHTLWPRRIAKRIQRIAS